MKKRLEQFVRVAPDLLLLGLVLLLAGRYVIDPVAGQPILSRNSALAAWIASAWIRVSCGILHAHLSRKWLFRGTEDAPFDLRKAIYEGRLGPATFFAVWYGVIIFAWARGG